MSDRAAVDRVRSVVERLFPWLVQITTVGNVLRIRSADARLELQGPGPAVARVGDEASQLAFYPGVPGTVPPSLWISYDGGATWARCLTTIVTGPPPNTVGSPLLITKGSARVTCG